MRINIPVDRAHEPYVYASEMVPELVSGASQLGKAVYQYSRIPLREFEGARHRVAQINGCMICQRFRAARDLPEMFAGTGVRDADIVLGNGSAPDEAFYDAVEQWRTSDMFTQRERLAIEFAERFGVEPHALATDEE